MKKLLFVIIPLLLLAGSHTFAQNAVPDTVVYGGNKGFPPYEFIDKKGKPAGLNVDLIRAIAKEMGFNVKVKLGVWSDIVKQLEDQNKVQITDMYFTKEREQVVDYANPIEVSYYEMFLRKGQNQILAFDDLPGKKVAVESGSLIDEYLTKNYPKIKIIKVSSELGALQLLSNGNCDAAFVSNILGKDALKNSGIDNLITLGKPYLTSQLSFVVKKGNEHLLRLINKGLIRLKENGKFTELQNKWINPNQNPWWIRNIHWLAALVGFIILFFIISFIALRYLVRKRTRDLKFSNTRLSLIAKAKATRIDKYSAQEQITNLLEQIRDTFKVDACVVRIVQGDKLRLFGSVGIKDENLVESIPVNEGFGGKVIESGKALGFSNASVDPSNLEFRKSLPRIYKFTSYAGAPLIFENNLIGVIGIYSELEKKEFSEMDLEHLQIVADQLAVTFENSRLYEQNEKQKEILVKQIFTRKKAEAEIKKLNEDLELRVAQRTAELLAANKEMESFVYSVSHDLRAPLRSIMGFSEIISRRHKDNLNEEGQEYFGYVVEAAKNMANLIEGLLKFSRLGRNTTSGIQVPLKDILETVLQSLNQDIMDHKAKIILPEKLPVITGDKSLLGQIFANLINNAIRYHRKDVDPEIRLTAEENEDTIVIKVQDNGMGIPKEHFNKIFNLFQRLHSNDEYPGTGIGLALVKKAVNALGGSIYLESEVGAGTTFIVEFPKVSDH